VGSYNKESLANTFLVALSVCLVCSIIVSAMADYLKPIQQLNKELDQKQNILRAAGLLDQSAKVSEDGRTVNELFSEFTVRAVDLKTGEFLDQVDTNAYDPIKSAKKTEISIELSTQQDIATIRRRENVSLIYLKMKEGLIDKLVLPVRGYGLWGTLYGYLALEGDLTTISGIGFYKDKETPGLGGEINNAKWKASWKGVRLYDADGFPSVSLVKTRSDSNSESAQYEVDALSGATFTTRGVENLVNFWTGELGFGVLIERLRRSSDLAQR
jgi:Na+-transporting NADH:ubiquinone oxidoreductase subunit C